MKKIIPILISAIFFLSFFPGGQPGDYDTNAKMKAIFVYNFTKYFDWPQSYKEGDFVIGTLGESTLSPELMNISKTKMAGAQKFNIKQYASVNEINKCHVLIIPPELNVNLNEVLKKIKGNSTLLITEKSGYAKMGSVINFVVKNNTQQFEFNKNSADKCDLKVSSKLLALKQAIVVE